MEDSNDIAWHLSQVDRGQEPTEALEFDPNTGKLRVSTSKCSDSKYLPQNARALKPTDALEFDPITGQLRRVSTSKCNDSKYQPVYFRVEIHRTTGKLMRLEGMRIPAAGFFGGQFVAGKDRMVITPRSSDKNEVSVTTMHLSCKSDVYNRGHNYGGVIIYQYDGKSEWRTANNTHCKSGYIVIQDADREDVKKWFGKEPGQVHGAVYRNAFGESVNDAEVVGEGFAIRNETFEMNSGVFNNPKDSPFHDRRRRMHELSAYCVTEIVESWTNAGSAWLEKGRNFGVEYMLNNFDFRSFGYKMP